MIAFTHYIENYIVVKYIFRDKGRTSRKRKSEALSTPHLPGIPEDSFDVSPLKMPRQSTPTMKGNPTDDEDYEPEVMPRKKRGRPRKKKNMTQGSTKLVYTKYFVAGNHYFTY